MRFRCKFCHRKLVDNQGCFYENKLYCEKCHIWFDIDKLLNQRRKKFDKLLYILYILEILTFIIIPIHFDLYYDPDRTNLGFIDYEILFVVINLAVISFLTNYNYRLSNIITPGMLYVHEKEYRKSLFGIKEQIELNHFIRKFMLMTFDSDNYFQDLDMDLRVKNKLKEMLDPKPINYIIHQELIYNYSIPSDINPNPETIKKVSDFLDSDSNPFKEFVNNLDPKKSKNKGV